MLNYLLSLSSFLRRMTDVSGTKFVPSVSYTLRPINLEKVGRKQKSVRKRAPENLIRRAGTLKNAKLK